MSAGRRTAIHLFLMAAIGAVLGLVGPFGSSQLPAGLRLLFWVAAIVGGYLIFRPVSTVADWLVAETRVPRWLATIMTALVAALPLSALIGFALGGMRWSPDWFGSRFPILYAQVAGLGITIQLLMTFLFRETSLPPEPACVAPAPAQAEPSAAITPQPEPAPHPFLRRLPIALRSDLLSLEMQDHYLQVRTRLGTHLLLMRFRDAVNELGDLGLPVHRSWWVAYSALETLEQDGRNLRVRLSDGSRVPVSRANAAAVRAAIGRAARPPFPTRSGQSKDRPVS